MKLLIEKGSWTKKIIFLRPLKNEWGATLAGDLAQTALLKRRGQTYVGPDGWFNTSLCARGTSRD